MRRAHIRIDEAVDLDAWVGRMAQANAGPAPRRFTGGFDDVAVHVILPAVVDAPQPGLLIASIEQGCLSMRAVRA